MKYYTTTTFGQMSCMYKDGKANGLGMNIDRILSEINDRNVRMALASQDDVMDNGDYVINYDSRPRNNRNP